jgi:SSS family solute:Na+ symporter
VTSAVIALGLVAIVIVAAITLGVVAARANLNSPTDFVVGGRSLGSMLLWLLLAGEIYTSFTFLGAAGYAYGLGAPAFYILCYGPIAYIIGYFLTPKIRSVGAAFGMITQPDMFRARYGSPALAGLAALVGFFFLIPYITLQLTGLQILLSIASYGFVEPYVAVAVAVALITGFVWATGLRGTAWASVLKDSLVLAAAIFAGVALPIHAAGGWSATLRAVSASHPGWLTLAPGASPHGVTWFVTTVIVSGVGFFMWPTSTAAIFSAKSGDALRRNAIMLPVYNLLILFVIFAGFAALLIVPGLKGTVGDQAFMLSLRQIYPPWLIGLIAAAGCLAALVPVSAQLLAAASIFAKNIAGDMFNASADDRSRTRLTRILVIVLALVAYGLWFALKVYLVDLLLYAYNGIVQFLPGTLLAFGWRRTTAWGVGSGIVAGIGVLIAENWLGALLHGMNPGIVALAVNFAVTIAVSALTAPPPADAVERFIAAGYD